MNVRSFITAAAAGTIAAVAISVPALAHIDPEPKQAQAGSHQSVGFTVQHGCSGSPTVQLDMRLPDGVTDAAPEPLEGWTGTINDNVVTFQGGPLPDDQELTFRVAMTLPPTPDTTIYFPFVQRCETGETRWIDIPNDDTSGELDEPAPAMALVGPVATTTTTDTTPPPTSPSTPTSDPTAVETSAPPPTAADTSPSSSENAPPSTVDDDNDTDSDSDSGGRSGSAGTVAVVIAIAVALAVAALAVLQARRRQR